MSRQYSRFTSQSTRLAPLKSRKRDASLVFFDAQRDESKRDQILAFFCQRIGRGFRTDELHAQFGTAFRTRAAELNRDPDCVITIRNHTEHLPDGREGSYYRAERRSPRHPRQPTVATTGTFPEFDDLAPGPFTPLTRLRFGKSTKQSPSETTSAQSHLFDDLTPAELLFGDQPSPQRHRDDG